MMKVTEIFKSIQGESSFAGLLCVFVRLAGCNLRCSYCDTTYAYDKGTEIPVDEILEKVKSFNGQRTQIKELKAFGKIANFYKVKRKLIVSFEHLKQIGGSSLTDAKMEIPNAAGKASGIPTTYVPFRNAHLLAVATSWAEVIGATRIFIGASEEDSAGYPDCRQDFYKAFNQAIQSGTKPQTYIDILTPLIRMKKADIVKKGTALGAPFELTWSCYRSNRKACGKCDSCARRLKGFKEAGIRDPMKYL